MRDYASGAKLLTAVKIDNVFCPGRSTLQDLQRGEHWFLEGSAARVRMVYEWCKAIELLCSVVPENLCSQPLPKPRSYCGYTKNVSRRDADYAAHRSTTWLVRLVESASEMLFPEKYYKLRTYNISYIARMEEVDLAETAFTRCTESQLKYGGFCVAAPGQCYSAKLEDLKPTEREAKWESLANWREENMSQYYLENAISEDRARSYPNYVSPVVKRLECEALRASIAGLDRSIAARRAENAAKEVELTKALTRLGLGHILPKASG